MNASRYIHPMDIEEDRRTETDSEEEDEEIMMLVFPALYAASSRAKTPCYTSKLSGAEYISMRFLYIYCLSIQLYITSSFSCHYFINNHENSFFSFLEAM